MPTITDQYGTLTAQQIIAKHQKTAPVNVVAIAEDFGIKVWETHALASNISGKIFKDNLHGGNSGFSIAVNFNEDVLRKRFTIAHEIGHFVLHRARLEDGELVDDSMYRSGLSSAEEAQANKLAAQILMPSSLIETLISSGVRDVDGLARRLQVSVAAMKIRLGVPL